MEEMNIIHQLYLSLGCNLEAQPETWKDICMIGFQFLAVLYFSYGLLNIFSLFFVDS